MSVSSSTFLIKTRRCSLVMLCNDLAAAAASAGSSSLVRLSRKRSIVVSACSSGLEEVRGMGGIPCATAWVTASRSEEHTSELQSQSNLVCRLLLEKKKTDNKRSRQ